MNSDEQYDGERFSENHKMTNIHSFNLSFNFITNGKFKDNLNIVYIQLLQTYS